MRVKEKAGTIDWAIKNIFDYVINIQKTNSNSFSDTGLFLRQTANINKATENNNRVEIALIGNKYQKTISKSFICVNNTIIYDEKTYSIMGNEDIIHIFNADKIISFLTLLNSTKGNNIKNKVSYILAHLDDLLASLKTTKNGDFGYKIKDDTFEYHFTSLLCSLGITEIILNTEDYLRLRLTEFGIQMILETYAILGTTNIISKCEFDKRSAFIEGIAQPENLCQCNPFNQKYWITNSFDRVLEVNATSRDYNDFSFVEMQEIAIFSPINFFDVFLKRSLKNNHIDCLI